MQTLTSEDFAQQPERVLADAMRAESPIVTDRGEPLVLLVALERGSPNPGTLLEIAAKLYDKEMISLERAAGIAGLSYSQTIDEFGRRGIAAIRITPEEPAQELASFSR